MTKTLALIVLLLAALSIGSAFGQSPSKVLFIGNSLTYFQDGIYYHLERLAASAKPPRAVRTDKVVFGGAYFKTLWERREPREVIAKGGDDVVVLQEDLPETTVAAFKEFAPRFVAEIRKAGGRPILLMAWSYERLGWISMEQIAQAHREVAKELKVEVAPVGLAWQRVQKERRDIDLFLKDREHPSIYGTYLATCVVYATIFRQSPIDLTYVPSGINPDAAAFLRRVAWETVRDYQ